MNIVKDHYINKMNVVVIENSNISLDKRSEKQPPPPPQQQQQIEIILCDINQTIRSLFDSNTFH
jgi:hypothetical protein